MGDHIGSPGNVIVTTAWNGDELVSRLETLAQTSPTFKWNDLVFRSVKHKDRRTDLRGKFFCGKRKPQ